MSSPPRSSHASDTAPQPRTATDVPDPDATVGSPAPSQSATATRVMDGGRANCAERVEAVPGYEILGELGRGGMGIVYKARQTKLNRLVALKMILAGSHAAAAELARFQTEGEAIARLQHANIVQVHEVGEHEGMPFFSFEYCGGGSLEKKLNGTPLPPCEAAALVETLARAMQAAHAQQIIHRDLKPANVLLLEEGTPKITDFGLAKKLDEAGQTQSGTVIGTPSYMAPEQACGRSAAVGPAADVYALGAILYECLTGRPPFKAATTLDTIVQVVRDDPVAPSQLQSKTPRDLETICLKCLRKEPEKRYASAADLAEDLRRFQAGEPILARPAGWGERLWRWCRRRPGWAALIAVSVLALLALLGGGAWFTRQLKAELARTEAARRETAAAQQDLRVALSRQVAERLDSDLRQLAAVPQAVAAGVGQSPPGGWDEAQLEAWLRDLLDHEPRLFGLCVAFEPRQFAAGRDDYALYVYRTPRGVEKKLLLPPAYVPLYRDWDWYREARTQRQAAWGEPYVDKGGGDIPMITCSAPILRGGQFAGVVTVDLSIDYFAVLRSGLDELRLGRGSYGFVVSRRGTLISHPEARYCFPQPAATLDSLAADDEFAALARRILAGESGSGRAVDGVTGRPATFLFAPVSSSGWAFVAVVPDGE